ncbi:DUF3592 domain-containing protein [Devosia sp. A449]
MSNRHLGQGRRKAWRLGVAATLITLSAAPMALAQELRSGSALAGVQWPVSAYDWSDGPGGPRQLLLEQGAAELGGTCSPTREFHVWNLVAEEEPEQFRASILTSYAAAGWTLTEQAGVTPTVFLTTKNADRLVLWLNELPEDHALALFSCRLEGATPAAAISSSTSDSQSIAPTDYSWVISLIGLGFVGLGVVLGGLGLRKRRRAQASAAWDEVPALIVSSIVDRNEMIRERSGEDNIVYTPIIHYSYVYDGKAYEGKRLRFGSSGTDEQADAEAIVAQYIPGATVTARVNPQEPGVATLLVDVPSRAGTFLFPILLAIAGAFILSAGQSFLP